MKWNLYHLPFHTLDIELFFSDDISQKSMRRNLIELSSVFSLTVSSDDTHRESPDKNNLPLNNMIYGYFQCDHRADRKLRNDKKEGNDRENKVFKRKHDRSCGYSEETRTTTRLRHDDKDDQNYEYEYTKSINDLTSSVVFKVVFSMFRISRVVVLRVDGIFEMFFYIPKDDLHDKTSE
jgi:hypothetical protein